MTYDLALVCGILLGALSIPSLVSAFSDERPPRVALVLIVLGGGLGLWALNGHPDGYTWDDIPEIFVAVWRRLAGAL